MPPNSPLPQQTPLTGLPQGYPLMNQSSQHHKKKHNWWIPIAILFAVLFLATAGFATVINSQKDDYKNNVAEKVAAAEEAARKEEGDKKEADFLEREKNPYREYKGPAQYGSLDLLYPKTWAAWITETTGSVPVSGFFHPNYVPGENSKTQYALRVLILEKTYTSVLAGYENETKQGKVRVTPFSAVKVPSVVGARIDGEISNGVKGAMVLLPLRDKTIQIYTQAQQFVPDFNNIVLPNLSFIP